MADSTHDKNLQFTLQKRGGYNSRRNPPNTTITQQTEQSLKKKKLCKEQLQDNTKKKQ